MKGFRGDWEWVIGYRETRQGVSQLGFTLVSDALSSDAGELLWTLKKMCWRD